MIERPFRSGETPGDACVSSRDLPVSESIQAARVCPPSVWRVALRKLDQVESAIPLAEGSSSGDTY